MRILVNTKYTKYDPRKTYQHDFWMEMKRHADVTMSWESPTGEYDVLLIVPLWN